MNVYFLSGLGADRRAFGKLKLSNQLNLHYVDWIPPLPKEDLRPYTKRLLAQIDTKEPFILVGLSFGGIVAIELNNFIQPVRTIIISSVAKRSQLPPHHRQAGFFGFFKILPYRFFKSSNFVNNWMFGTKTKKDKELLGQILNDTDLRFMRWAIQQITTWDNKKNTENLFHIHGTTDRIFPIQFTKPDYKIKGGGHLMIQSHWKEISEVLNKELLT